MDLQIFCADKSSMRTRCYDYIQKPFNHGGFTYATDGCLMVEVPLRQEYEALSGDDKPKIQNVLLAAESGDDMRKVPTIAGDDERVTCGTCGGSGYLGDCTDCNATGWGHGDEDCKACGGSGEISKSSNDVGADECYVCNGLGQITIQRAVRLSPTLIIQAKYLNLIASLPNARLLFSPKSKNTPVPFCFDGGRGWVMQMRHDIEIDFDLTSTGRCPQTEDMFS